MNQISKRVSQKRSLLAVVAMGAAFACAGATAQTQPGGVAVTRAVCKECGVVEAVREVEKKGESSGLAGAAVGGVVGGLLGNQIGKGRGKDVATVAGAVGGAVAGHQIEKKMSTTKGYETTVRFDDGHLEVLSHEAAPAWRVGNRVRIVGGSLQVEN